MPDRLFGISWAAGSKFVSREVAIQIRLGLEEFAIVREQFESLLSLSPDSAAGVIGIGRMRDAALLLHGN